MMEFHVPWWAHLVLGCAVGVTVMFPVTMLAVWWATRLTPEEKKAERDYKRQCKAVRKAKREVADAKRKTK